MRFGRVSLILLGSFLVYCAQDIVGGMKGGKPVGSARDGGGTGGGMLGDGMVGTADAQSNGGGCCTPQGPTPTVLFDQAFTPTKQDVAQYKGMCVSPVITVSGYRTIVIHSPDSPGMMWSFGGAVGWVNDQGPSTGAISTRDAHYGKQLLLTYGNVGACVATSATVVGYND